MTAVELTAFLAVDLVAYLLGSIPTGFLVAKARGVDIRTVGSGNIGATNTFRVLGKPAGILVLLFDALKGCLACVLGAVICAYFFNSDHGGLRNVSNTDSPALPPLQLFAVTAGICAVLGHN